MSLRSGETTRRVAPHPSDLLSGVSARVFVVGCVRCRRGKMILSKAVVSSVFLITVFNAVEAKPHPSVIRERHVIHAPIKFKVIHHYKIKKIPIVIKKHIHYHKEPADAAAKPIFEEIGANHIHQDDGKGFPPYFDPHNHHDGKTAPHHSTLQYQHYSNDFPPHSKFPHQDDSEVFPPYFDPPHQEAAKGPDAHRPEHRPPFALRIPHDSQEDDYEDDPTDRPSQESYDDYDYE